ncbi:hypothetical protein BVY04_04270 [bacterium M21]|nr:hypothetical protein BVY04_04270 [bacterium M21]
MSDYRRYFGYFAICFLCACSLWADALHEDLTNLKTGRKFKAIVLRTSARSYVVATDKGIETMPRTLVQRIQRIKFAETTRLNALFSSVENALMRSNFDTAREQIKQIDDAILAFEKAVAPKLFASSSSTEFKAAIGHCKNFYKSERARIEPTIKVFQTSTKMLDLNREFEEGKRYTGPALVQMANLLQELNAVQAPTPLAKRSREDAAKALKRHIGQCEQTLIAQAVKQAKANWDVSDMARLLQTLREIEHTDPSFAKDQEKVIKPLIAEAAAFCKTLAPTVKAGFTFDNEPKVDTTELRAAERNTRNINAALESIRDKLFGPDVKTLRQLLNMQIGENKQALDDARTLRDTLQKTGLDFARAHATLQMKKFDETRVLLKGVVSAAKEAKVSTSALETAVADRLILCQGREIFHRISLAEKTDDIGLQALVNETRTFIQKHAAKFEPLNLSRRQMDSELRQLQHYLDFKKQLGAVKTDASKDALSEWQKIVALQEQLDDSKKPIHPLGKKVFQQFMQEKGNVIFAATVQLFEEGKVDLKKSTVQQTLLSLIDQNFHQKSPLQASRLIAVAYGKLEQPSAEDPFVKQLIDKDIYAARELSATDGPKANAIFTQLRKRFPVYFKKRGVDELLLNSLYRQGQYHERVKELPKAVTTYERILTEDPDYAARVDLFKRILELKVHLTPALKNDRSRRQELLESYCQDYAHRIRKLPLLEEEKAAIVADFRAEWDDKGNQLSAIENILALDEAYPNMLLQAKVIPAVFADIKSRVFVYRLKLGQQSNDVTDTSATMVVPGRIVKGLSLLFTSKYKFEARRHSLDAALVEFRVAEANRYLALGSVKTAFDILHNLQREFPVQAESNRVSELLASKENELLLQRVCEPLGIRKKHEEWHYGLAARTVDLSILCAWVVFWFIYLLNALKLGRKYRHIGVSLRHYLVVFGIFLGFMVLFLLMGQLNHTFAAVAAFIIPAVILNILTQFSYRFFPLIYVRRQLNFKKLAYAFASRLPGIKTKLGRLEGDIANLEMDLPLLHDQWLFRIERAIRLAVRDPQTAYQDLTSITEKLTKEWSSNVEQHRTTCLFHMGRIALDIKQYDAAKKHLNDHLEKEPRNGETHALLASLYFTTEDYSSAVPHYKVCLSAQSKNDTLWYQLGRCFFETGKYKSAYKCFDTIETPDRDSMFYNARTYACVGKHKKSVEWYQKLLKENSNDGEVIYFLASSFAQLKDDVKAFKIISLIKKDHSFYPHALGLQGSLLLRNGKTSEATEFFERALRQKSDLVPALHGIGQIHLEAGRAEAAIETFEQLLKLEPDSPAANYYYGVIRERSGEADATKYFEKAIDCKPFKRLAAVHAGRCRYFAKDYAGALEMFKIGLEAGDTCPWTLFLYADSLVAEKELSTCRKALVQLFGHESTDPEWKKQSAKGVYTIGYRLFSQGDYHMASQCFDYVQEHLPEAIDANRLEELVAETHFRTIVDLIKQGKYTIASQVVAELQLSTTNAERSQACQFYMAVCKMYEKDFAAAGAIISALLEKTPDSVRYQYHSIVCEIGNGNDKAAADILSKLRDQTDLPEHITVGIAMVRAYMLAILDKVSEAEQLLADVNLDKKEGEAVAYIRYRLLAQRAEYLCRIQDSTRLQFLLGEMDEKTRSHAAYLQALSSLEGGHLSAAVNNLQPFATKSKENAILFCALSSNLAAEQLQKGSFDRALQVLDLVTEPTPAILFAKQSLQMAGVLENIDDAEGINEGIVLLDEARREAQDPQLSHSLIHNLAVLKLRLAIMIEETRDKEEIEELWQEVWEFWTENVFESLDYWEDEYVRIRGTDGDRLGEMEIKGIVASLREDIFLPTFIGATLSYLSGDGQTDLIRHLNYIIELGKEDEKLKDYVQRLGITAKHYVDSRPKGDPILKTWGFVIGYLQIQVAVREVVNPNEVEPLRQQLRVYQDYRNHYSSPNDYMQAKKAFNTAMLDALQHGIEGKFSKSGDALEKSLSSIPHGIILEKQLESALWKLRELARNPGIASEQDINLSQEYERMYQRVLNHSLQKGN